MKVLGQILPDILTLLDLECDSAHRAMAHVASLVLLSQNPGLKVVQANSVALTRSSPNPPLPVFGHLAS
jgi:hypothetical protein